MKLKRKSKNIQDATGKKGFRLADRVGLGSMIHRLHSPQDVAPLVKLKGTEKFLSGMDKAAKRDKEMLAAKKNRKNKFLEPKSIKDR